MSPLMRTASLTGHRGEVLCLGTAGDGKDEGANPAAPHLASGGEDGSVRLWDLSAGRAVRALMLPQDGGDAAVNAVCLGSAGASASWVYAASGSQLFGFDLRAPGMLLREPATRLAPSSDEISHLCLNEADGVVAAADDSGEVRVHSLAGADCLVSTLSGAHTSLCGCSAFRPGRAWELYSVGLDSLCVRWDWKRGVPMATWPLARAVQPTPDSTQLCNPRHVHCASFAPDGAALALALGDGSLEVLDAEKGEPIAAVDAHLAAASQVLFAPPMRAAVHHALAGQGLPSGWPLVSTGDDGQVKLWSVEGVSGRGVGGAPQSKRRKGVADASQDEPMDDGGGDDATATEPGFRCIASGTLKEKPNWVACVGEQGTGRGVICVATTGAAIDVLAM
jgi:WD40 repeat protein